MRINVYDLDLRGLDVLTLERDAFWFDYICSNRGGKPDALGVDVVMGPIANDTIFDTLGVTTSGFLTPEQSLELLRVGPNHTQVALKTPRAVERLVWAFAETPGEGELARAREAVAAAERAYLGEFTAKLDKLL